MMTPELWAMVRHFKPKEFDSKGAGGSGTGNLMNPFVVFALDLMRRLIGMAMSINSAYRTPAHNKRVGGAPNSAHLRGLAVDVDADDAQLRRLIISWARKLGFTGIGIADGFIHLDMLPRTAAWVYHGGKRYPIPVGSEMNHASKVDMTKVPTYA